MSSNNWVVQNVHVVNWCNILICPHFPGQMRGTHKWNTSLCTLQGLQSTPFSTTQRHTGMEQDFTLAHGGASGILCKPECYTGFSLRANFLSTSFLLTFWSAQNESKAYSHQEKVRAKAKKISESAIKIKENVRFRVRFCTQLKTSILSLLLNTNPNHLKSHLHEAQCSQ